MQWHQQGVALISLAKNSSCSHCLPFQVTGRKTGERRKTLVSVWQCFFNEDILTNKHKLLKLEPWVLVTKLKRAMENVIYISISYGICQIWGFIAKEGEGIWRWWPAFSPALPWSYFLHLPPHSPHSLSPGFHLHSYIKSLGRGHQ